MRMALKYRTGGWQLGLLLMIPMVPAAGEVQDETPSLDFLEFLGEWEDEQGNWQDPLEYEDPGQALSVQIPDTNVEQNNEAP